MLSQETLARYRRMTCIERDSGDIEDVLLAQSDLDAACMRRWPEELGLAKKLEEVLLGLS